jgi:hypothetical protein
MSITPSTFADYRPPGPRAHGCVVCGATSEGVVILALRQIERTDNGSQAAARRQIASRSASLCQAHAIELFETAVTLFPVRS